MNQHISDGRSVAELISDLKVDVKQFVETRIAMLKTEVGEKLKILKVAVPLAIGGLLFLATAFLLLTLSAVNLVFVFLPDSAYSWVLAFLAVGILWAIIGGVAAYFAKREFSLNGLLPSKTIRVLQGDKKWIESEVKDQDEHIAA